MLQILKTLTIQEGAWSVDRMTCPASTILSVRVASNGNVTGIVVVMFNQQQQWLWVKWESRRFLRDFQAKCEKPKDFPLRVFSIACRPHAGVVLTVKQAFGSTISAEPWRLAPKTSCRTISLRQTFTRRWSVRSWPV